jgi:hypothetical protein
LEMVRLRMFLVCLIFLTVVLVPLQKIFSTDTIEIKENQS